MKKSRTVWDMLKNQNQKQKTVSCPACGSTVLESQINQHLDFECSALNDKFDGPSKINIDSSSGNIISLTVVPEAKNVMNSKKDPKNSESSASSGKSVVIIEEEEFLSSTTSKTKNRVQKSRGSVTSMNSVKSKREYTKRKAAKVSESCDRDEDNDFVTKFSSKPGCKLKGTSKTRIASTAPSEDLGNAKSNKDFNSSASNHLPETTHFDSNDSASIDLNTDAGGKGDCEFEMSTEGSSAIRLEPSNTNNNSLELRNVKPNFFPKNLKITKSKRPVGNTSAPWRSGNNKRYYTKRKASRDANSDSDGDNKQSTDSSTKANTAHAHTLEPKGCAFSEMGDGLDLDFPGISSSQGSQSTASYSPYYIANFKYIISAVLSNEHDKHLFNSDDIKCIDEFYSLSDRAQKLYVRLFQRKYRWLRPMRINYPQIAEDLNPFLSELVRPGFLEMGSSNMELETALDLLSLTESKSLSKHFNFNVLGKNKSEINQLLINHGKQHKSFFFCNGKSSVSNAILKRVQQIMGPVYRLSLEPKRLFTRILMLFSLPTIAEDDEEAAGGQQQQLFTLLQVNKGEVSFPAYEITRECLIFETRDDLIRYEVARQLENDILNAIEAKRFEEGKGLYVKAEKELNLLKDNGFTQRDASLPPYLRRYSAGHVYTRCLIQGVEALQKLREYEEAVELLRKLLDQTLYCQDRRGKWWERIALNLQQHLKKPQEAAEALKEGLKDKNVRVGLRLSLLYRAERIANSKNEDEELKALATELSSIIEAPKVTIHGRLLPRPIPGRRHIFISSNTADNSSDNTVTILSVEEVAIEHYNNEGYSHGVHGEGSTFISLYTLLFWDILYDGRIPDAFISPYQNHPLDLNSDCFYERRQKQISDNLETIRNSSIEDLTALLQCSWTLHYGVSSLVNWELFTEVDQLVGLINCLGNTILAGICERLAKDFRFTRSGVPDLVVWNPDAKIVKIVEVKGPGDKLSPKQILWLDYLLKLGVDAEVCLVEAAGSKKLKKKSV